MRAFLLILVSLTCFLHGAKAVTIAFEKGGWIYVAQPDGSKARKVTRGVYPDISADGSQIVFNTEEPKTTNRKIAQVDVATGKVTVIPNIPSDNCFGPVWSPDGRQVAFHMMRGPKWEIGLVNVDGSDFCTLSVQLKNGGEVWQPEWAADGKSLFCHDLSTIFQVNLAGKILRKWPVTLFAKGAGMNSGSSLAASPDGRFLLVEADMDTEVSVKDWDGPPPALWKLDLHSEKITLVNPLDFLTWAPCWLNDKEILCVGATGNRPNPGLYQLTLKDGQRKFLLSGATSPSASRR